MESMHFIFDGVKSYDMDLRIMRIDHSGFIGTPYFGGASINESVSRKRVSPYFYGVEREPIEFPPLQLVLVDRYGRPKKWTPQERNRIAGWLLHDTYKSFQTSDDLGKYYYVIATSDTDLELINTQGYMEVVFRTSSPYAWSPMYTEIFELSNNTGTQIIELENKSNISLPFRPKLDIEPVGSTEIIEIRNLSNNGQTFKLKNLINGEIIGVDCENKIIKSNKIGENAFKKFNVGETRYWLDMVRGVNRFEVKGKCNLRFRLQYPIAQ